MTVYAVFLLQIHDHDYMDKNYTAGFLKIKSFAEAGGQILVASDENTILEGPFPYSRVVISSFPSDEALRQWYDSEEYQALVKHRVQAATTAAAICPALEWEKAVAEFKASQTIKAS